MSTILRTLFLLCLFPAALFAQLEGEWFAVLDAMGTKLPMKLALQQTEGQWSGLLLDPTKPDIRLPLQVTAFDGRKLRFTVEAVGITYDGILDEKEIRGIFNQANVDFPLTYTRHRPEGYPIEEGPLTIRSRKQDPRDFPYKRKSVSFPGGADGVQLAGELTLPEKGKPAALIVLVSGSGPQDRNAYLGSQINHSPFLILSDYLTRQGYGVLRYDERGVAESTGQHQTATTADLADDAAAAVAFLKQQPAYKKLPVGMIGHSEGGLIAPMVATEKQPLDFVILLAAPGYRTDSLMLAQRRRVAAAMGMPEVLVRRDEPALRAGYQFIRNNPQLSSAAYVEGLYAVFEQQLDNLPKALRNSITDPRKFNQQYVAPLSSPWMRYFLSIDPQKYLQKLTIPLLALNGTKDTQVPPMENLNAIRQAMAINGNQDASVLPVIDLNHLFQPAQTGAPQEYGTIETTFDPATLTLIGQWLGERFQ